jgi:hypothetical protein
LGYITLTVLLRFATINSPLLLIKLKQQHPQIKTNQPASPQANMQFSKLFLFATAATIATAAPTGVLEARDEYKVSYHNGKWQKGWEDTEPSEQYICQSNGLLVCV